MQYDVIERLRLNARDGVYGARTLRNKAKSYENTSLVLCNSYPKSGTHLLSQILTAFPQVKFWNDIISVQSLSGVMNTPRHIRWKLKSVPPGGLVRSHLMYAPEVLEILAERPVKRTFMYRDLRDVAVSHANWVLKEPAIFLHGYYKSLPDFDACLMATIKGTPVGTPFGSNLSQPDIGTDFSRWLGWTTDPETLSIRFEDLVGERGGGDEARRIDTIVAISQLLDSPMTREEVAEKFASTKVDPEKSHTFRKGNKGAIGGWREKFTEEHKAEFKRVAGDMLIRLGDEQDNDW
jgi:sulfotransferase 6B1